MAPERRNQLVLATLAIALAVVAYRLWPRTTATPGTASTVRGTARTTSSRPAVAAPDVRLEALGDERPKPGDADRNLFRFRPKPAPPPAVVRAPPVAATPTGPPPSPAVPPIALKFIAYFERPERGGEKIAVLSDGRGGPSIWGREGGVVEGRYRIVRIGTESIEMSYVDGRGRQTIRLTGQ